MSPKQLLLLGVLAVLSAAAGFFLYKGSAPSFEQPTLAEHAPAGTFRQFRTAPQTGDDTGPFDGGRRDRDPEHDGDDHCSKHAERHAGK